MISHGPHWLPWLIWPVYCLGFFAVPAVVIRKLGGPSRDLLGDLLICLVAGMLWPLIVAVTAVVLGLAWVWRLR